VPRAAAQAVVDALAGSDLATVDLWTFVLPQGTQRWVNGPADVVIGATTWSRTAPIVRLGGPVTGTSGVEVATLDVSLEGGPTIGGSKITALAATGSFDDADVLLQRLYLPTPATAPTADHLVTMFRGYVSDPVKPSSSRVDLVVRNILGRAEDEIPRRQVGPMCPWTWGDSLTANRCGIVRASYQASDTINATGTTTQSIVLVTGSSAYLVKGATLTFSDGQQRVIQSWTAGTKTAVIDAPLAAIPSGSITIHRGCDKTPSATTGCGFYANLVRFGGWLQVPMRG
jgi:hypothetical protein